MNAMFMQAALANLRIPEVEISGDGEEIPYDYDLVNDPHRVLCGLCMQIYGRLLVYEYLYVYISIYLFMY